MKKQSHFLALSFLALSIAVSQMTASAFPEVRNEIPNAEIGNIIRIDNFKDAKDADLMKVFLPDVTELNGSGTSLNTRNTSGRTPETRAEEEYVTLTCILESEYEQPFFAVYNDDFYIQSNPIGWMESESFDTYRFQVPVGVFDVNVQFSVYNGNAIYNAFLVRENVEITEDTILYFSPEELTERMVFQPKLRNGELAQLPLKKSGQDLDTSNANITYAGLGCIVEKIGGRILATSMGQATLTYDDYTGITFLCNQFSDSYRFTTHFVLVSETGELQISTTDFYGVTDGFLNNYIDGFAKYECPRFVETPIYNNESGIPISLQSLVWMDDIFRCGYILKLKTDNPQIYATCEPVDWNLKPALQVSSIQDPESPSFFDSKEIVALPAIRQDNNWEYINSDPLGFSNPYPGLPEYCYTASQLTQPLGNNAPIMAMYTQTKEYNGRETYTFSMPEYIGRYGEKRKCDTAVVEAEAYFNGVPIYNSATDGSFRDWIKANANNDREEPGNLEVLLTDNNVSVDGIRGCNFSLLRVNETSDDKCVPGLRMLIFKDKDGTLLIDSRMPRMVCSSFQLAISTG